MVKLRNAALWTTTIIGSIAIPLTMVGIIGFVLPLSASDALNRVPKGAHELGFWLLFLLSLPFWLVGFWQTTLATVREQQSRRRGVRRAIWVSAWAFILLAIAARANLVGFGDVFRPA